jgi:hypothetical protein
MQIEIFTRLAEKTAYLAAGIDKVLTANGVLLPSIRLIYDFNTF